MSESRFAYQGPAELLGVLTQALERVIDPEVGMNIVEIGLVYAVKVAHGIVNVDLTMTSAACPVADLVVEDTEDALDRALPPELKIHVELVWEPPWTPQRMSATARAVMGW